MSNPNSKPESQNGNANGKRVIFVEPGSSRQNAQSIKLRSRRNLENPYGQSRNVEKMSEDEKGNTTDESESSDEEISLKNEIIRIPFLKL